VTPERLPIMRHAEKPTDPTDQDLSRDGYMRANNLVAWLPKQSRHIEFLIASAISKHSARPFETVPFSKASGIPIDSTLGALVGQYPDPWDKTIFNLVLQLDYDASGTPKVTQLTEPF
jgi:hypothetical protein